MIRRVRRGTFFAAKPTSLSTQGAGRREGRFRGVGCYTGYASLLGYLNKYVFVIKGGNPSDRFHNLTVESGVPSRFSRV